MKTLITGMIAGAALLASASSASALEVDGEWHWLPPSSFWGPPTYQIALPPVGLYWIPWQNSPVIDSWYF